MTWWQRFRRPTRSHPSDGEWMAFVDRQLLPDREAYCKAHLNDCASCRTRFDALRQTAEILRGLAVPDLPAARLLEIRGHLSQAISRDAQSVRFSEAVTRCLGPGIAARLESRDTTGPDLDREHVLKLVEAVLGRRSVLAFARLASPDMTRSAGSGGVL